MSETDPPPDRDAAELRAFLAERDVACPGCGYNLRGLTEGACPECNRFLILPELREGLAGLDARRRSPWAAVAVVFGWIGLAESSGMVVALHDGEPQAGLAMLPAFLATFMSLPLILLCLLSLRRAIADVVAMLTWLWVVGMVLVAILVWF